MKKPNNITKLALAVSMLAGSQAASALTPWPSTQDPTGHPTPYITVYTAGGSAQTKAIGIAITNSLAASSGSVDVFEDSVVSVNPTTGVSTTTNGGNFTAYYFTGGSNLHDPGAVNQPILLVIRTLGSAGYGVVPLLDATPIDNLNILNTTAANWTGSGTTHLATINSTTAPTYLTQVASNGGLLGVDAASLLQAGYNYPDPVPEISTTTPDPWSYTHTPADLSAVTIVPTGGEVYGIAVTQDLYAALQAAQIADGTLTLPGTDTIGAYTSAADLPSLSRNFVASLLAGEVKDWNHVYVNVTNTSVNGKTLPTGPVSLVNLATDLGLNVPTDDAVGVGLRNNGAAIGAVAYSKFLNYPFVPGSQAPALALASPDDGSSDSTSFPLVKLPTGTTDTDNLLNDWDTGQNTGGHNLQGLKVWGLAIQTADRNNSTATTSPKLPYRYVKIDGYAATIDNVASGNYPVWAEGQVLINKALSSTPVQTFLSDFGTALASVATATTTNAQLTQAWGSPGIFNTTFNAGKNTTTSDSITTITNSVPYSASNPVIGLTHQVPGGTATSVGIVPYAYDNTKKKYGATILLK